MPFSKLASVRFRLRLKHGFGPCISGVDQRTSCKLEIQRLLKIERHFFRIPSLRSVCVFLHHLQIHQGVPWQLCKFLFP